MDTMRRRNQQLPRILAVRALLVWAVVALLAASCSSGGSAGDDGDEAGGSSTDEITGESVADGDGELGSDGDTEGVEPIAGPTLDGSASPGEVTDLWTMVDDTDFVPDADRSLFDDMEGDVDGGMIIAGSIVDHDSRSYRATVWYTDDAGSSLTRTDLPTLLEGVVSDVSDVEFVPAASVVAAETGITRVVAGSVGSGPGQRAAVWIHRNDEWSQVEADAFAAERREWTNRLSVGPSGELLVLGSTTDAVGEIHPIAWRSTDGEIWTRLPEAFDAAPDTSLADAAIGEAGTVVIARVTEDAIIRSHVYVSVDGTTWEHAVPPSFSAEGDVQVRSVVTGPDGGFVAVGSVGDTDDFDRPASWTSTDGVTWNGPSTSFGLNDDGRSTSSGFGAERVRVADGRFLAISTDSFFQHVWQSNDGMIWNPLGNIWEAEPDGVDLAGIAVLDGVTVTIGEGRVYRRAGGEWSRLPPDDDSVPKPAVVPWSNAVASNDGGFLIVGGFQDEEGELFARAWASGDGSDWTEIDDLLATQAKQSGPYRDVVGTAAGFLAVTPETTSIAAGRNRSGVGYLHAIGDDGLGEPNPYEDDSARVILSSIATFDDRVVLAGLTFDGNAVRPILLEGTVGDAAYEPFRPSLIDRDQPVPLAPVSVPVPNEADREAWSALCASDDAAVAVLGLDDSSSSSIRFFSRSADGTWVGADSGSDVGAADDFSWANACDHGRDGFLVVGGRRTGSDTDGSMWISAGGSAWEQIDPPEVLVDPAANGWVTDVATDGSDYLVVGNVTIDGGNTGMLWIGAPSTGWTAIPAANDPIDFEAAGVAVNSRGAVVVTGWQDGQMTVVTAPIEDLRQYEP